MITLAVNELMRDVNSDKVYRLLWIDEGSILTYVIDIEEEKALPFLLRIKDISQGLLEGTYVKVNKSSNTKSISVDELPIGHLKIRDKSWGIIKELVRDEPLIYKKKERSHHINELVKMKICTKKTAYRYLRKYWQNGMTINSLLPNYENSGAKGKERKSGVIKKGRPRTTNSVGINVTDDMRVIFNKAIKKYYFTSKKNSLSHTYKMMIKEYYSENIRYENGVKHIVILDEDNIPTLRQFSYWFKKEYGIEQVLISREGKKKFERDYRAVLGSSTYETMGPGSRYQIDATIGNIYLLSSYNSEWIIGRPILYFVVDVFTHMITGMYIGLEGPSWAGMMMAIANATMDKQEFCEKYGVNISHEMWPAAHLPEIIVGDRGELEGYNVNSLIDGLNISIENNPSFRPDWKGIVEKLFDTSQEKIKPFLPGYIQPDFGERGAEDYRLDAKLTLEQYTKIIINFVLHYNQNYYMKNYIRDTDMITDNVRPTPNEIWKWGVKNRAGKLRRAELDTVKFYLMPRGKATITPKGIKFKGMLYSSDIAIKELWFTHARKEGSWKVNISYDPRNMNIIYLHTNNKVLFEECFLLEHQERYQSKIIEEIEQLLSMENENYKNESHYLLQEEINFFSNIEAVVKESLEDSKQTQTSHMSKTRKIKNIQENRKFEKGIQRKKEAFQMGEIKESIDAEIIDFNAELSEDRIHAPSIKDLFNKKRGRKNE